MKTIISSLLVLVLVAGTVSAQNVLSYDRRIDLSTQPQYAPFGQMPQDYRDGPSLYSSGNVRYGRAFRGNRTFIEDRYFDTPISRFYRDSVGAYDVYGQGRQWQGAQPYYAPGSLVTRGDTLTPRGVGVAPQADPFGVTVAPPPTFVDPVDPVRSAYPGIAPRTYAYVPSSVMEGIRGRTENLEPTAWSRFTPEENLRQIEADLAAREQLAEILRRGTMGTPLSLQQQLMPAEPGTVGRMPNPWLLLPGDVQQELLPEPAEPREPRTERQPPPRPGAEFWDEAEAEADGTAPSWLRRDPQAPSIRDRLIEAMREGAFEEADEPLTRPQDAIPYGGRVQPSDLGDRSLRVGRINLQVGLYRQAIEQFQRAAMLDLSLRDEARRLQAHAHLLVNDDRVAGQMLSDSILRMPEKFGRDFRLTQVLDNPQAWQQTQDYLKARIEQIPDAPIYQFLYGYTLRGQGLHNAAEPYLRKLLVEGNGFEAAARILLQAEP